MIYFAGIDVGSVFTKAVILSDTGFTSSCVVPSTGNYKQATKNVLARASSAARISVHEIVRICATGIGAGQAAFSVDKVSERASAAKGTHLLFPSVRTIIEVGGQATRIIKVDNQGRPLRFVVSDKCAAGSGRFLQMIARVLQLDFDELGPRSLMSQAKVDFSTTCAVFAESEAIARLAEGASKEGILAGVHHAIASKVASMVESVNLTVDCVMIGGGARDIGLVKAVAEILQVIMLVPEEPSTVGALGAALTAREKGHKA